MKGLRHAVIVRLHYQPGETWFEWRKAFFRSMVLPRLTGQTCQGFEIWVVCRLEHIQEIEALGNIHARGLSDFPGVGGWKEEELAGALPRFDVQTFLDSDDLVSLDYIERIQEEVGKHLDQTFIVSFQPYKLNLLDLRRYVMWERYHQDQCSMFYSLYVPAGNEYRSVLGFDHSFVSRWCSNVMTIPEGYCDMVIHGSNMETGLEPNNGEVK